MCPFLSLNTMKDIREFTVCFKEGKNTSSRLIKFGSSGSLPNRCYFLYFNKGILTPEFYASYHCHFFHRLAQLAAGGARHSSNAAAECQT